MKLILRRLRRLEEDVAGPAHEGPSWADTLRERRRQHLLASGQTLEERPYEPLFDEHGKRQTWAAVLRKHRARRYAASLAARKEEQ
jgi:hypothetical protein